MSAQTQRATVTAVVGGRAILLDLEDALRFVGVGLRVTSHGYVKTTRGEQYLHRLVVGAKRGEVVDHINGDKFDNRRANLRVCTQAENARNARLRSNNRSGVAGVYWSNQRMKWIAQISVGNRMFPLGRFESFDEAVRARVDAEEKFHGPFAASKGVLAKQEAAR